MAEFPKSTLRIFLSIDIVGSTAYKQSTHAYASEKDGAETPKWLLPFSGFFADMPKRLQDAWSSLVRQQADKQLFGDTPKTWKFVGDEIIFEKTIEHHLQPLAAVFVLRKAIENYRPVLKSVHPSLDLKGSAWIAGFPVSNSEVILYANDDERSSLAPSVSDASFDEAEDGWFYEHIERLAEFDASPHGKSIDFIGPHMDIGFRISKFATPRKIILAVDLAWMVFDIIKDYGEETIGKLSKIANDIVFEEAVELKGVLSGVPYPVFWIGASEKKPLAQLEFELLRGAKPPSEKVSEYCNLYMEELNNNYKWMIKPFFYRDGKLEYGIIPEYHKTRLDHYRSRYEQQKETERRRAEDKAGDISSGMPSQGNPAKAKALTEKAHEVIDSPPNSTAD